MSTIPITTFNSEVFTPSIQGESRAAIWRDLAVDMERYASRFGKIGAAQEATQCQISALRYSEVAYNVAMEKEDTCS